jgi:diaminopimelate epimerase
MTAHFFKYHALGNDMVVIDPARFAAELTPEAVRRICRRHFGLGADGICFGPLPGEGPPLAMRFFNPDGSEAEKSGNGLRIFARYLWDAGYVTDRAFNISIHGETIPTKILDASATTLAIQVGRLDFASPHLPVTGPPRELLDEPARFGDATFAITAVSVGNPHCVIFVDGEADLAVMARYFGPRIETDAIFPQRTNVQFVRVVDAHTLEIEIRERGAGYTLASGTSACATAGAALKTGRCRSPVTVRMAGGEATVAVDEAGRVTLTGSVAAVGSGQFAAEFVESW